MAVHTESHTKSLLLCMPITFRLQYVARYMHTLFGDLYTWHKCGSMGIENNINWVSGSEQKNQTKNLIKNTILHAIGDILYTDHTGMVSNANGIIKQKKPKNEKEKKKKKKNEKKQRETVAAFAYTQQYTHMQRKYFYFITLCKLFHFSPLFSVLVRFVLHWSVGDGVVSILLIFLLFVTPFSSLRTCFTNFHVARRDRIILVHTYSAYTLY